MKGVQGREPQQAGASRLVSAMCAWVCPCASLGGPGGQGLQASERLDELEHA